MPLDALVVVVVTALFGTACYAIGRWSVERREQVSVEREVADATAYERELRVAAEDHAAEVQRDDVWLRMMVRSLRRQLADEGVEPWLDDDDTPPPRAAP